MITKNNKQWFSILLAMWITLVTGMIAILILEFIIPFSRNIKWVENSSAAFYQSYSGIEEAMWFISQNDLWAGSTESFEQSSQQDTAYSVESMTNIIPPVWKGNSEYDSDRNRFDNNFPIQLAIPDKTPAINFSSVNFTFRIPVELESWNDIKWNDDTQPYIINWIITGISNQNGTKWDWDDVPVVLNGLNSELIEKSEIWDPNISIWNKEWRTIDWATCSVKDFIDGSWACNSIYNIYDVTLKMSLVDQLILENGKSIPYLEYQIDFWSDSVPWRYTQIETSGKSYGFRKNMDIKVPQQATNQAFDFAVFQ